MTSKTVMTTLCRMQEVLDNRDLDSNLHDGFTIGERGKRMYWYISWTRYGNAAIYTCDDADGLMTRRYVSPDQIIKIHFK